MPKYDSSDKNQKKLCDLSKKAHMAKDELEVEDLIKQMDEVYLNLCKGI